MVLGKEAGGSGAVSPVEVLYEKALRGWPREKAKSTSNASDIRLGHIEGSSHGHGCIRCIATLLQHSHACLAR